VVNWIYEAILAGARQCKACEVVGISERTLQRWRPKGSNQVLSDLRPLVKRSKPVQSLTKAERQAILRVCNQAEFASLPPSQIVPKLADQGIYLASESSFYRVLRSEGQQQSRGRARKRRQRRTPTTHIASGPNQVWTWDITYLPSKIRGQHFYLYLVEDLFSRYGVMWEVHERESGELAAELIQKALWREKCLIHKPVLHSDNGSPMKSQTMRTKLQEWGVTSSHSRPGVSDDNAYVESFFRTLKYCPQWPPGGFASLEEARAWVHEFMRWYNHEHQHSQIRFVTPFQRHQGLEKDILKHRKNVYEEAKSRNPQRWSRETRNWTPIGAVALNPVQEVKNSREAA
jgi:putative transposase